MRYLMLSAFILLASCAVTPEEWEACEKLCEPNEGVARYWADWTVTFDCDCKNGMTGDIK